MNDLKNTIIYLKGLDPNVKLSFLVARLKSNSIALELIKNVFNLMNHICNVCENLAEKNISDGSPYIKLHKLWNKCI